MESRERLIEGLQNALNLMTGITQLQNKRVAIRTQYTPYYNLKTFDAGKSMKVKAGGIGSVIGLFLASTMVWNYIAEIFWLLFRIEVIAVILAWVTVFGLGIFAVYFVQKLHNAYIKKKNERICEENKKIIKINEPILEAEKRVIEEINNVQMRYCQEVAPWYPGNYCYIEAAAFFLNAIRNYRADNLKEAINLYEDTRHNNRMEQAQQRIINNQQAMIQQQKLNNVLAMGQIVMQAGIQNAIVGNTHAVNRNTSAVYDNTQAVNRANDTLSRMMH